MVGGLLSRDSDPSHFLMPCLTRDWWRGRNQSALKRNSSTYRASDGNESYEKSFKSLKTDCKEIASPVLHPPAL